MNLVTILMENHWFLGGVLGFFMMLGMFRLTFTNPATRFDVIMAAIFSPVFGWLTVFGATVWFLGWVIATGAGLVSLLDWLDQPARKKHR